MFFYTQLAKKLVIEIQSKLLELKTTATAARCRSMQPTTALLEAYCQKHWSLLESAIARNVMEFLLLPLKLSFVNVTPDATPERLADISVQLEKVKALPSCFTFGRQGLTKVLSAENLQVFTEKKTIAETILNTLTDVAQTLRCMSSVAKSAKPEDFDWSSESVAAFLRLLDSGLPTDGYINASENPWFAQHAPMVSKLVREVVALRVQIQLESAKVTKVLGSILTDQSAKKAILAKAYCKEVDLTELVGVNFASGLKVLSKAVPGNESKRTALTYIKFKGFKEPAVDVFALAAILPYLKQIYELNTNVSAMAKTLTLSTAIGRLYERDQDMQTAAAQHALQQEAQPKKKAVPAPVPPPPVVYRQTFVGSIYAPCEDLATIRSKLANYTDCFSEALTTMLQALDLAVVDCITKVVTSMMSDYLKELHAWAKRTETGPHKAIADLLATTPKGWQNEVSKHCADRVSAELFIFYQVTKNFMNAMTTIVPALQDIIKRPEYKLDESCSAVLSEVHTLAQSAVGQQVDVPDIPALASYRKLGVGLGNLALAKSLTRPLRAGECSRQVVIDQVRIPLKVPLKAFKGPLQALKGPLKAFKGQAL